MNRKQQFTEGLITNNPVLVQQIGMCATMAITTTLFNGVGMGLSVLIILTSVGSHHPHLLQRGYLRHPENHPR